jgi:hypothetical protein
LVNTAPCTSKITYINGEAGALRYRGYPIEELAEHSTFLETSYLLIYGDLPTRAQLESFTEAISIHTLLHGDLKRFFDGFPIRPTRCRCCPVRCPRDARPAQRVGADAHASGPHRVEVDHVGQLGHISVEEVEPAGRGAGTSVGNPADAGWPGGEQLVSPVLYRLGNVQAGRAAVGRVVLDAAVLGGLCEGVTTMPSARPLVLSLLCARIARELAGVGV